MGKFSAAELNNLENVQAEQLNEVKSSLLEIYTNSKKWTPKFDTLWEQVVELGWYMLFKEVWPQVKKLASQLTKLQLLFSILLVAVAAWAVQQLGAAAVIEVLKLAVGVFLALQLWFIAQVQLLIFEVVHVLRFSITKSSGNMVRCLLQAVYKLSYLELRSCMQTSWWSDTGRLWLQGVLALNWEDPNDGMRKMWSYTETQAHRYAEFKGKEFVEVEAQFHEICKQYLESEVETKKNAQDELQEHEVQMLEFLQKALLGLKDKLEQKV